MARRSIRNLIKWFKSSKKQENDFAWKVNAKDILANGCNLDIKNPHSPDVLEHLPPEIIVKNLLEKNAHTKQLIQEINRILKEGYSL